MLFGVVVCGVDFAFGPVTATFGAVEPHLHVFDAFGHRVIEEPADFKDEGGAGFEADEGGSEVFDVVDVSWYFEAAYSECAGLFGDVRSCDAGYGDRAWIAHEPEGEVEDVDTDVDAGATAGVFFHDETGAGVGEGAAQHPRAGVVNVAEGAFVEFGFHGFGVAGKAEVLGGHEEFSGFVAGGNHVFDEIGIGCEGFFADDVFACFEGGDGEGGVVVIGGADVDDVDVGVFEEIIDVGVAFGDVEVVCPTFEYVGVDVAAGDEVGVL